MKFFKFQLAKKQIGKIKVVKIIKNNDISFTTTCNFFILKRSFSDVNVVASFLYLLYNTFINFNYLNYRNFIILGSKLNFYWLQHYV